MGRAAITLREALPVWFKVACLSFGGPAGQIAVMQRLLVDEGAKPHRADTLACLPPQIFAHSSRNSFPQG